jgi:hypothetical protein
MAVRTAHRATVAEVMPLAAAGTHPAVAGMRRAEVVEAAVIPAAEEAVATPVVEVAATPAEVIAKLRTRQPACSGNELM